MSTRSLTGYLGGTVINITNNDNPSAPVSGTSGGTLTATAPLAISSGGSGSGDAGSSVVALGIDTNTLAVAGGKLTVATTVTGAITANTSSASSLGVRTSTLENNVSSLTSAQSTQSSAQTSTSNAVQTLQTNVQQNTSSISTLQSKLVTDESNIATNATNVANNASSITAINSSLTQLQPLASNLTSLSTSTPSLPAPLSVPSLVAATSVSVGNTSHVLDSDGKGLILGANGGLVRLRPTKASTTGEVTIDTSGNVTVPGTVAGVNLPGLQTTQNNQAATLASQSTTLTSVQNNVSQNTSDISTLKTQVVTAGAGLTSSSGAFNVSPTQPQITSVGGVVVATLNSSVTQNTSDISSLKSSRTADEANISTNTSDISSLKSSRTTDEANIAALQASSGGTGPGTSVPGTRVYPAPNVSFPVSGTVTGAPYGNGTYTFATSVTGTAGNANYPPCKVFYNPTQYDAYGYTTWLIAGKYSTTGSPLGAYTGSSSVVVGSTTFAGEWNEMTLPSARTVTAITLQPRYNVNGSGSAPQCWAFYYIAAPGGARQLLWNQSTPVTWSDFQMQTFTVPATSCSTVGVVVTQGNGNGITNTTFNYSLACQYSTYRIPAVDATDLSLATIPFSLTFNPKWVALSLSTPSSTGTATNCIVQAFGLATTLDPYPTVFQLTHAVYGPWRAISTDQGTVTFAGSSTFGVGSLTAAGAGTTQAVPSFTASVTALASAYVSVQLYNYAIYY